LPRSQGNYQYSVKKAWFSDPATYPLMVAIGAGAVFMVGMGVNALATYKDVRINPAHKHHEVRDWGREHHDPLTAKLALNKPTTFHRGEWTSIRYEGLGVDHNEWMKQKKAEMDQVKSHK
jgi:hypothetical protein